MTDLLVAQPDGSLLHTKRVAARATILIGRHPASGIVISNDLISRRHALVFEHESSWYAVDLNSTAGVESPTGPISMHRFDPEEAWVNLGPVVIWVDGMETSPPPVPPVPIRRTREPVVRTRGDFVDRELRKPALESPSLILACRSIDPDRPDVRLLDLAGADRVLIGRDPSCDLVIDDESVPELAFLLYREDRRWAVVDLRDDPEDGKPRKRRRRFEAGTSISTGPVRITVTPVESAVPRTGDADEEGLEADFGLPDLGSIFDAPSTMPDAAKPEKPGNSSS